MTPSVAAQRARAVDDDVLAGLRAAPKRLPCRLLYDEVGSGLFERICRLDAYYPTRVELALLVAHLPEIAAAVGSDARVIEPGSGEGVKTGLLLDALDRPAVYVPIDVARDQLDRAAAALRARHPALDVTPLVADYTRPFVLPPSRRGWRRSLAFFPGSTIGNFEPADAVAFLAELRRCAGPDALLVLGADSTRDEARLLRAYDDEEGVTAAFDRNVLVHVNRTHGATFEPDRFEHRAVWNPQVGRIEMHLVSDCAHLVWVNGAIVELAAGEPIITEHCYKHTPSTIRRMLAAAGWSPRQVFVSGEADYGLWLCAAG